MLDNARSHAKLDNARSQSLPLLRPGLSAHMKQGGGGEFNPRLTTPDSGLPIPE